MAQQAIIRKRITCYGQVQGVGFRFRAKQAAAAVGATGWVRNEYDGSVTMEIQGTPEQIDSVTDAITRGRYIRIEGFEVMRIPVEESERGFRSEYC